MHFLALLVALQLWIAPGSETCPEVVQDEVGLMQLHAQITSKRDISHQHAAGLSEAGSVPEPLPSGPQEAGHRGMHWRVRVQSVREWGDRLIYGVSDCYGAVVMSIAERIPGSRHRVRHYFSALLEGARGGALPRMVDGGEGMPVGACCALVAFLLLVGLARWILQGSLFAASGLDGKGAGGLLEMRWWHIFVLMQLDCMTPITQDSYIPSMPVMAMQLNTTDSAVGLSLQVNWVFAGFIAFALGVASDKYGRRPALLTALTCYVVGALLCAISPNIECLIFARCIQGIGGGSQPLCYAIARDAIQNDDERSRLFSVFAIAATIAIAMAPIAGGLLAVAMGWRMVFVFLAAWGLLAFWNVFTTLPETCPAVLDGPGASVGPGGGGDPAKPQPSRFGPIIDVFRRSLKPLGMMLSMWMLMPILMSILSSMPFVLDNAYEAGTTAITWCTSALATASLAGSAVCFVLMRWWTSWRLMRFGMCGLLLVGGGLLLVGLLEVRLTMVTFMILPALYIMFLSTLMGPMRSLVAQPFGAAAGAANGLVMSVGGPVGALFGFTMTWILQQFGVFAWMIMLGTLASFHQTTFWGLVGPAAEDDPVFDITEGYLQFLKSKGKGKGK